MQWNDSEEKVRVAVEDHLIYETNCKIRDKESFYIKRKSGID